MQVFNNNNQKEEKDRMKKWVMLADRKRQEITDREIERLIQFSKNMMVMIGLFAVACIAVVTVAAIFAR